ncbi:IS630 family transposase [Nocardia sp. NBC_01377]|uniref:IS630 family transposase n=1 Tax=Nocardia sp. NBC_01377 TaxID=2903595 RepID=UPI0032447473
MGDDLRMDMRRLSPGQQEALRMRVMGAMRDGMTASEAQRVFGVSEGSIRNWRNRLAAGGVEGLESGRPGRRAGDGAKLTPSQAEALVEALIVFVPEQLELGGLLWTLRKVAELARRLFGVSFTEQGMGKVLRRMGFTFQRPDRRAIEANPEAMAEWVRRTYPALAARAKAEDAVILFGDQVGVRSDQLSGRTWGRRGQTPTLARTGKRFCLNAMSTISPRGDLHFTVFRGRFNAKAFLEFLTRLLGQHEKKIHLVVDGHPVHRSKAVTAWVADRADRIELHFLPAYAPHLNPDELVNADLKRTLADQIITTPTRMETSVRSFFHRVQKLPGRVRGYFQAPHTIYASTI